MVEATCISISTKLMVVILVCALMGTLEMEDGLAVVVMVRRNDYWLQLDLA